MLQHTITLRNASDADIAACARLDLSYDTDYVWQIDVRDDDGAILIGFRTARLPRPMRVVPPRESLNIYANAETLPASEFIVAESGGLVMGYLIMRIDAGHGTGWVTDIGVGRQFRRQRLGTALLNEAYTRAQQHDLRRLTVETQSKNYPSILFCQKNGLAFCGFNDRYYPSHDIALFFGQTVRD